MSANITRQPANSIGVIDSLSMIHPASAAKTDSMHISREARVGFRSRWPRICRV